MKGHTPRRWGPREERAWFTLSPRTTLWIKTGRTPASVEAEKPDCTSRHVWTLLTGLGFLKKLVELPGGQSRTLVQASAHGTTKKDRLPRLPWQRPEGSWWGFPGFLLEGPGGDENSLRLD